MWLRNWEHNATSGTPVSGATVEARTATLTSPNVGAVVASTITNADGMWEFTSLPDAAHDIKVIYLGNVWWHKGLTKHNVDAIFYNTPVPRTDQFMRNAGFEGVKAAGPWTVTNVEAAVFDSWLAVNGAGSSATVSRDTGTVAAGSQRSAKVVQTKVAGTYFMYQNMLTPYAFRTKQVTFSIQVHQSVASQVQAYISDSAGVTLSSTSATTGSFVTLTVTRTIDAAATSVQIGVQIGASGTFYFDNAIAVLGAVAGTYGPEYTPSGAITNDMLATGVAVANLGYTPVNKAGDSMSGLLTLAPSLGVSLGGTPSPGKLFDVTGSGTQLWGHNDVVYIVDDANTVIMAFWQKSPPVFQAFGQTVWTAGTDGAGSGLDADLLDGVQGSGYAPASRGVPDSAVVWFPSLALLAAAGASWARYSAADGRLLIGDGTTFGQTFVHSNFYGSSWTPAGSIAVSNNTLAVGVGTLAVSNTLGVNAGTLDVGGSTGTSTADTFVSGGGSGVTGAFHTHTSTGLNITGSPALSGSVSLTGAPALSGTIGVSGTTTAWVPPMIAGVWGQKI